MSYEIEILNEIKNIRSRLSQLEKLDRPSGSSSGVTDHGELTGLADDDHTQYVDNTSAETIAGIKTFSSIPVLPSSDPTSDDQAVRKSYVDDTISNSAIASSLSSLPGVVGAWSHETIVADHRWQAWSPTVTYAGGVDPTSFANDMEYCVIGRMCYITGLGSLTRGSGTATYILLSGIPYPNKKAFSGSVTITFNGNVAIANYSQGTTQWSLYTGGMAADGYAFMSVAYPIEQN